jgi:hypothetical protein
MLATTPAAELHTKSFRLLKSIILCAHTRMWNHAQPNCSLKNEKSQYDAHVALAQLLVAAAGGGRGDHATLQSAHYKTQETKHKNRI